MQTCDLCDKKSHILHDFYGKWACQDCLATFAEYYGNLDCGGGDFYYEEREPYKSRVTFEELDVYDDDLGFNINVKVFTPDWSVKKTFGLMDIEVESFDIEAL